MNDSPDILLYFSFLLLGAGIALWRIGKYGKRIDRHPLCRKCGFDLYGTIRIDYTCGECGARTYPPEGIRVGNRRAIAWMVYVGTSLLMIGTCGVLFAAPSTFAVERTARHKPAMWLRMDALSSNADLRGAALTELTRRMYAKEIGLMELTPLIEQLLVIQADKSREWLPVWGDFIEDARGKTMVNAEQWQRYLDHCVFARQGGITYAAYLYLAVRAGTSVWLDARFSGSANFGSLTLPVSTYMRSLAERQDWELTFTATDEQASQLSVARTGTIRLTGNIELFDPGTHAPVALIPVDLIGDDDYWNSDRARFNIIRVWAARPSAKKVSTTTMPAR